MLIERKPYVSRQKVRTPNATQRKVKQSVEIIHMDDTRCLDTNNHAQSPRQREHTPDKVILVLYEYQLHV